MNNFINKFDKSYSSNSLYNIDNLSFRIEDTEGDILSTTDNKYASKIFKISGFKSLRVANILNELAGYKINDFNFESNIYLNSKYNEFIVSSASAFDTYKNLTDEITKDDYKSEYYSHPSSFVINDEILVSNKNNGKFILLVILLNEYITIYSLSNYESDKLFIYKIGDVYINEENQFDIIKDTITRESTPPINDNYDKLLNTRLLHDILISSTILKKRKSGYSISPDYELANFDIARFVETIRSFNYDQLSYTPTDVSVSDIHNLINSLVDNKIVPIHNIYWIYEDLLKYNGSGNLSNGKLVLKA